MKKPITNSSSFKKQLLALKYRVTPREIAECISLYKGGKSPWWIYHKEKFLSQKLVERIIRDYQSGVLDFLDNLYVDRLEKARKDPYRRTRYEVVREAEDMAPHRWWNLGHMKTIGMDDDDARRLLIEYDQIRLVRKEAEITADDRGPDGEKTRPSEKMMANFNLLPRYLAILYEMYYRTEYPGAPLRWIHRASSIRVLGQQKDDSEWVEAADDMMRYRAWEEDRKNLQAYYRSLGRFRRTARSRELFVEKIRKQMAKADEAIVKEVR